MWISFPTPPLTLLHMVGEMIVTNNNSNHSHCLCFNIPKASTALRIKAAHFHEHLHSLEASGHGLRLRPGTLHFLSWFSHLPYSLPALGPLHLYSFFLECSLFSFLPSYFLPILHILNQNQKLLPDIDKYLCLSPWSGQILIDVPSSLFLFWWYLSWLLFHVFVCFIL